MDSQNSERQLTSVVDRSELQSVVGTFSVIGTCVICRAKGPVKDKKAEIQIIKQLVGPLCLVTADNKVCLSCSSFMDKMILLHSDFAKNSQKLNDVTAEIQAVLETRQLIPRSGGNSEEDQEEDVKPIIVKEELIIEDNDSNINEDQLDTISHLCENCGKSFRTKLYLTAHLAVHDETREQYECRYCEKKFVSRKGWGLHTKRHEGLPQKRIHKCYFCNFTALTPNSLELHMLSHTMEKPWKCKCCEKRFTSLDVFKNHTHLVHIDSVTYHLCPFPGCEVKIRRIHDLRRHVEHHDKTSLPLARCEFKGCSYTTAWPKHLAGHVKRVHEGQINSHCKLCGKGFFDKRGLALHLKRKHSEEKECKCSHPGCDKAFAHQSGLKNHMKTHSKSRDIDCSFCGFKAKTEASLQYHVLTKHGNETGKRMRILKCYFCQKEMVSSSAFGRHMRVHTGEKPYKCSQKGCEKVRYRSAEMLSTHLRKIHGIPKSLEAGPMEPRHQCQSCDKSYLEKRGLARHIARVHENVGSVMN